MRVLRYANLDTSRVTKQFKKLCQAIERDDFYSAEVKKLEPSSFYRAKLDDSNRLLISFVSYAGQTVCLALEVIAQHRYDKSRFLRGARVDESKILADLQTVSLQAAPLKYLNAQRSHFYLLDKVLSFDHTQEAILHTPPPMILVGSAGSGKTALTLEKLRQQAGQVLYVTHSAYLAQHARNQYFSYGFENPEQEPLFLSFRELLETLRVPPGRELSFSAFRNWFERHRQTYRFTDAHQIFEEFRGVLSSRAEGPLEAKAYLELGVRQSIFAVEQRESIYALFQKYLTWLKENQLFDVNLVSFEWQRLAQPSYDFIVIDEAQDLTSVQLALILKTLKQAGQFLLCGDANQIVHPNFFSWSAVKSLFWQDPDLAARQRLSVLRSNFRNAREVTRVANGLLKIKQSRFGSIDRESNFLIDAVAASEGTVEYLPDKDSVKRELNQKTRASAQVAVLVLRDEDKAAARSVFQTPLLFSVHEAKGLEYPTIILYRLISGNRKVFAEICEGVSRADLEADQLEYRRARDKGDKSLEIYKFYINALYVALTRAVERVIMLEADTEHPLLHLLEVQLGHEQIQLQQSSREDWEREAAKLELQGKEEQATAIRQSMLKVKATPWQALNNESIRGLEEKAFASVPSSKAQRSLFDYALWHEQSAIITRLQEANFAMARAFVTATPQQRQSMRKTVLDRYLADYRQKNYKQILWDCDSYGTDFRNIVNATPLMMAAVAGNLPLVEDLLARGADVHALDHYGHQAASYALNRAFRDADYAKHFFGPIYQLTAPDVLDVQVDERLVRLYPQMGEFFIFMAMLAGLKALVSPSADEPDYYRRRKGFFVDYLWRNLEQFPETVVREERRKRSYFNHVLARAELNSSYLPARKLWLRASTGYYFPNPDLKLRVKDGNQQIWKAIDQVLNFDHLGLSISALKQRAAQVASDG